MLSLRGLSGPLSNASDWLARSSALYLSLTGQARHIFFFDYFSVIVLISVLVALVDCLVRPSFPFIV